MKFSPSGLSQPALCACSGVRFDGKGHKLAAAYMFNGVYVFDTVAEGVRFHTVLPPAEVSTSRTTPSPSQPVDTSAAPKIGLTAWKLHWSRRVTQVRGDTVGVTSGGSIEKTERVQVHGHMNRRTIKECCFLGENGEALVAGSDCGKVWLWDTETSMPVCALTGDTHSVNCVQPHPSQREIVLATSGIDEVVRIWAPQRCRPVEQGIGHVERDSHMLGELASRNEAAPQFDAHSIIRMLLIHRLLRSRQQRQGLSSEGRS